MKKLYTKKPKHLWNLPQAKKRNQPRWNQLDLQLLQRCIECCGLSWSNFLLCDEYIFFVVFLLWKKIRAHFINWHRPHNVVILKAVDTIGNCQRLAFTVGVFQYMHKITNLWKFELNRSSKLRNYNERRKHPCHTKLCAFRWLTSRPQVLNLRSWNQICGKLLLSRRLWHFRGSRFSQCFIPSASPHYSSPRKVLCS